jgi:hypothetical protein
VALARRHRFVNNPGREQEKSARSTSASIIDAERASTAAFETHDVASCAGAFAAQSFVQTILA